MILHDTVKKNLDQIEFSIRFLYIQAWEKNN
jgi:hypothetical protein